MHCVDTGQWMHCVIANSSGQRRTHDAMTAEKRQFAIALFHFVHRQPPINHPGERWRNEGVGEEALSLSQHSSLLICYFTQPLFPLYTHSLLPLWPARLANLAGAVSV